MYFASSDEMARLDNLAVEAGLEIRQMMELAGWLGLQLIEIEKIATKSQKISILIGKGNKGGDGLSLARHLINHGYNVSVVLTSEEISDDSKHHLELLRKMQAQLFYLDRQEDATAAEKQITEAELFVDALIGYRLEGAPRGVIAHAIDLVTQNDMAKVVSYDLPTGIEATTGKRYEPFISADYTLSLALPKAAQEVAYSEFGMTWVGDIGIPSFLYNRIEHGSRPNFEANGLLEVKL